MGVKENTAKGRLVTVRRVAVLARLCGDKGSGASLSGPRRLLRVALTLGVFAALLPATPAGAVGIHEFQETFGSAAQPTFGTAQSLAVDKSTGDLLVIDSFNEKVSRYNPDGTPANFSALGSNEIDGKGGADLTPQNGLLFSNRNTMQVAVDNSAGPTAGNIYVTQTSRLLVDIFAPSGAYLGQLTKAGTANFGEACGVAVDSSGSVYVGDFKGQIHKFVPSANPPVNTDNTANFSIQEPCAIAAGTGPTAGFIFVNKYSASVSKLDSTTGALQYILTAPGALVGTVSVDEATGNLLAVKNSGSEITVYDASGTIGATILSTVNLPFGEQGRGVAAVKAGAGRLYVSRTTSSHVEVFGPPLFLPAITADAPSNLTGTSAILNGTVDPEGAAITECKFEYGPTSAYGTSKPCEGALPTDSNSHPVTAPATGLLPNGTTYHFRIVATSTSGTTVGSDRTFSTPETVVTGSASGLTGTKATLNGTVNPEGIAVTECKFEYGPTVAYGTSKPCEGALPTDSTFHPLSAPATGLLPNGTTYHFRIVAVNASGTTVGVDKTFVTPNTVITGEASSATDTTVDLTGTVNADGVAFTECKFEYGPTTSYGASAPCVPAAGSIPVDSSTHPVAAHVTGLTTNSSYHYRLVAASATGPMVGSDKAFSTFGVPFVTNVGATDIADTSVRMVGTIDPRHSPTEYVFEYGTTPALGSVTAPVALASETSTLVVSQVVPGLSPGTTYHFKLVATNGYGPTASGTATVITRIDPLPAPYMRGYEKVSPDVLGNVEETAAGFASFTVAANGEALGICNMSTGGAQAVSVCAPYVSLRSSTGWQAKHAMPPFCAINIETGETGRADFKFSRNVDNIVFQRVEGNGCPLPPLSSAAPTPSTNLYHASLLSDSPTFDLLTPEPGFGTQRFSLRAGFFVGGSEDFGVIVYSSNGKQTTDAAPTSENLQQLYEWDHGTLRLVSVKPDGTPFLTLSALAGDLLDFTGGNGMPLNAVSASGDRIFFQNRVSNENGCGELDCELYMRESGSVTHWISQQECSPACSDTSASDHFVMADPAGDRALFVTTEKLTDDDSSNTGSDLYLYTQSDDPTIDKNLTLLTKDNEPLDGSAAGYDGVQGMSDDGQTVYFATSGQIVAGATTAPGYKLYRWRWNGGVPTVDFIGLLGSIDENRNHDSDRSNNWHSTEIGGPGVRLVSSDGRYVLLNTARPLDPIADSDTSFDVYRWGEGEDWTCLSCQRPDRPSAGNSFARGLYDPTVGNFLWRSDNYEQFFVSSDDGQRVFFTSFDALVPGDTNGGVQDVYEWHDGTVSLVSSGTSPVQSRLIGSSRSGDDVFFITAQRLVGWDGNNYTDVYDARVGGGFPEPAATGAECEGEACRGAGTTAPPPAPAGTGAFEGAGNKVEPAGCLKGYRKATVKGKVVCKKKPKRKHHKPKRGHEGDRRRAADDNRRAGR